MPLIAHPAIAAVLLEKSILDRVVTFLIEVDSFRFHLGKVIWMNTATPEIGMSHVLRRLITQQRFDILPNEGRPKTPFSFITIDYGGRTRDQCAKSSIGCIFRSRLHLRLVLRASAFPYCFSYGLFDYVGHSLRIIVLSWNAENFAQSLSGISCMISWSHRCHRANVLIRSALSTTHSTISILSLPFRSTRPRERPRA